jgi:hypothetical protein
MGSVGEKAYGAEILRLWENYVRIRFQEMEKGGRSRN